MRYEPVIGLEVHIQLATKSKIFCRCSTRFGALQNTQVCPICLGMPGSLPVLNRQVVEYGIRLALATHCKINLQSTFARKNYFYPDLPKGYQVSQFEEPFCEHGTLTIPSEEGPAREIGITRIHFEEDAGKSVHTESYVAQNETLLDLNRCGVPLLEIVSEPDMHSAKDAVAFVMYLRQIVRYLGICDGNMEEGSLRCDANISVRPWAERRLGVKTEIKNMNSFNSVEKAIDFEIHRQISLLKDGKSVQQETLLWDTNQNIAIPMRSKEGSHDYRYFPEPDLVPVLIDQDWIERVRASTPELPAEKKARFISVFHLPEYDAAILTEDHRVADYYEAVASQVKDKKVASNWVMGQVLRALKEQDCDIQDLLVTPERLSEILNLVADQTITVKSAKTVFDRVAKTGEEPLKIVRHEGLAQIRDSDLIDKAILTVLQQHPQDVQAFLSGKQKVLGFLVGQVMRATAGKAEPKSVQTLLQAKLATYQSEDSISEN